MKRAVGAGLAEFGKNKHILLDRLRGASCMVCLPGAPRPIKKPFNEEKAWRHLTMLAVVYFLRQATTHPVKREARLRKLAEALGRVRILAESVRQDAVGSDLISQLFDGVLPREPRGQLVIDDNGALHPEFFPEIDFKELVSRLDAYKAAVLRAALDVPTRQPGPSPVLPRSYIRALADLYGESTGREPGRGRGPFYRFVMQFRAALDPSYKTTDESGDERVDDSLRDAIQDALRKPRGVTPLNGQR